MQQSSMARLFLSVHKNLSSIYIECGDYDKAINSYLQVLLYNMQILHYLGINNASNQC
jgi:hypothetical protein